MNSPIPPNRSGQRANPRDVATDRGAQAVLCPLTEEHVRLGELTSGMTGVLESAGCPVAPAIQDRLRFEALLTELSAKFVNVRASEVDAQIELGLRRIVEVLGLDRSGLGEFGQNGEHFVVTHSYQLPGVPPSKSLILHADYPTFAKMIRQGEVVRMPEDFRAGGPELEYCHRTGLKSNLTIPLTIMGVVVGGIGFTSYRSDRKLPDELIPRLRLVGDILTNALVRKRADEALHAREQSLRQSHERLRLLSAKLLDAQEEERRRIAREMHDDWTQRLAVLGIAAEKLKNHLCEPDRSLPVLASIQEQLAQLSEDVHDLSRQLHPSILDDLGLVEALRSECTGFSRRTGIIVSYHARSVRANLPMEIALCFYRVAQEALRNIAKHAGVKEGSVKLAASGPELAMQIRDQGLGFEVDVTQSQCGLGLCSMEERVRLVRGKLSITSAPGQGTAIEVRVPLSECSG